jgi:hypothetical protein
MNLMSMNLKYHCNASRRGGRDYRSLITEVDTNSSIAESKLLIRRLSLTALDEEQFD